MLLSKTEQEIRMASREKKRFRFRAFTVLMMLWSFVLETVSGLVLYIVPPGRIANWTDWRLWGFSKHQWGAMHTIFGYVFLGFAVLHIYYNWKPILIYMKRKLRAGLRMRAELMASSAVTIFVFIATVISLPPFGTVMDIGEHFKNSWEESQSEPFIPHAELMTFDKFSQDIGISAKRAKAILKVGGIAVEDDSKLIKDIASENNVSPVEIYTILKESLSVEESEKVHRLASKTQPFSGRGYGWKTLEQLASELEISVAQIMEILELEGIEANETEVIRSIAERNDMKAVDIVNLIIENR
jgi:hypothetical protein